MGKLAPRGLGNAGKKLWRSVIGEFDLRGDELRILEDACRSADLIDRLENAMSDAPLIVRGSMGQPVANSLLTEIRQHRATLANLLRGLKLPNEEPADDQVSVFRITPMTRSEAGRKAARVRWGNRGA